MKVAFIDTETTGLHAYKGHEPWEIGILLAEDDQNLDDVTPFLYRVYPDLSLADPGALAVNRFYERTRGMDPPDPEGNGTHPQGERWSASVPVAYEVASMLEGALWVGNNPAFDFEMLEFFCHRAGHVLAPFHRKLNVVDMAYGMLLQQVDFHLNDDTMQGVVQALDEATALPHSSSRVLTMAGCPQNENAHTALGDARHVYEAFRHMVGR
jgi:DNA polymerase III epsilon subunit-like protein